MRFGSLVMALLLVSLFAPVAGAIYIPGQEIPDDGLMHIMSAETGASSPIEIPGGISLPALVPPVSGLSGTVPTARGLDRLFLQGFPAQISGLMQPVGDVIGHIASPPAPGYWDDWQNMDLHTNMPVIDVPAIFA